MTVVMAVAWPFFDRQPGDPWFDPEALRGEGHCSPGILAGGALAMIVAAPLWLATSGMAGAPLASPPVMPDVKSWTRVDEPPLSSWRPRFDGADYLAMARYGNAAGQVVDLAIATFDRQDEGRELVGFGQGAAGADSGWTWSQPALLIIAGTYVGSGIAIRIGGILRRTLRPTPRPNPELSSTPSSLASSRIPSATARNPPAQATATNRTHHRPPLTAATIAAGHRRT